MRAPRNILCALALLVPALPAGAQGFEPPQGCTGFLTIQAKSCLLINAWTCEGDLEGSRWLGLFTAGGLFRVDQVSDEFELLQVIYPSTRDRQEIVDPAADPANFSELVDTGLDTFDYSMTLNGEPFERRSGFDLLTGEETVIDGQLLLNTQYVSETYGPDGNLLRASEGLQFISVEDRLFLPGLSWDPADPDDINDATPVTIRRPGEVGFMASVPVHDCPATETAFEELAQ